MPPKEENSFEQRMNFLSILFVLWNKEMKTLDFCLLLSCIIIRLVVVCVVVDVLAENLHRHYDENT